MIVGGFEVVPAGESGGEHEDGGFWRVEIGDESVNDFEFEAWEDENVVFAFGFAGFAPEFESARDGGADSDDAVAGGFGLFDGSDGFFWDVEPFGMHVVFFDFIAADWQEGAEADVEGEILNLDAFGLELGDEIFGHVEAGGRSGGGAVFFSPNGLVAFDVGLGGIAVHVRWKRNVAELLGDLVERGSAFSESDAVAEDLLDSDLNVGFFAGFVIDDGQNVAVVEFAAIHNMVEFGIMALENNELAWAAIWELGKDAAAHDAGIIQNNEIAWLEKIGKIGILAVGDFAGLAVEGEQASGAANFWRLTGDTFVG